MSADRILSAVILLAILAGCAWIRGVQPVAEGVAVEAAQVSRCARDAGAEAAP